MDSRPGRQFGGEGGVESAGKAGAPVVLLDWGFHHFSFHNDRTSGGFAMRK
jgi:hypothetical protein